MNEIMQYLQQALNAANGVDDVDTVAAIAALMKKINAAESTAPPPIPMQIPAPPPQEPAADEPPVAPGVLYGLVRDQLETALPGHTYIGEDEASVTIEVTDETGNETYWRIPVIVAEDGTATLGEAEQIEPPAPEPQPQPQPPAMGFKQPFIHRRALFSPIGPKALEDVNNNEIWVNIVNLGEYEHPEYGPIVFTEEHFRQWKANLERGVVGGRCENGHPCIATDYGHAMDEPLPPEMQRASGYIKDLKLEGNRVYALVEFTPTALEGIKNLEWAWFSISVADSLVDQKTGQDVGSALLGGALTNRPFIPDLEPIRLSDLRPSHAARLQRELVAREAEIKRLKREKYNAEVAASISALEQARIPPSVIRLVRPLLEADFEAAPTVKLSCKQVVTPARAALSALLELAKIGLVPTGERTGSSAPHAITLEQAVAEIEAQWQQEGKRNYRRKDLFLAARRKYAHLRDN